MTKTAGENAASVVGTVNAIHSAKRIPFLTINIEGQMELHQDRHFTIITSKKQLAELLGGREFQVSSSIDFPKDHTKDKNVIDIAKWVRAGMSTVVVNIPTVGERMKVNSAVTRVKKRVGTSGWRMLGHDLQQALVKAEVLALIAAQSDEKPSAAGRMAELAMEWEPRS